MDKSTIKRRLEQIEQFIDVFVTPPNKSHNAPESDLADLIHRLGVQSQYARTDLSKLKDAGWSFSIGTKSSGEKGFKLVRDVDGHMKLVGPSLTMQLQPQLDRSEIDELLTRLLVKIRREFPFSKNTFLVEVSDENVLEKAKTLNDLDEVLYAEPNLVEPIVTRR